MDYTMDAAAQERLEGFLGRIGQILGHKKRRESFATYALGLLAEGARKSCEPIAARACADEQTADAAHQRLLHFVGVSEWDDTPVRRAAARYALDAMTEREPVLSWIIDDTGFLKQGSHSVGVQRQYTGSAGKIANCQLGVSLTVASRHFQAPVDFELYLPESWTEDAARRQEARIPDEITFKTKAELARDMLRRAVADGLPRGLVLADSFYGDDPGFRAEIRALGLDYGVGVHSDHRVFRMKRNLEHYGEPISVKDLGMSLGRKRFRKVTWRDGTRRTLSSYFAVLRVVPAQRDRLVAPEHREDVWLVIEWPRGEREPTKFSFSSLPGTLSHRQLVRRLQERYKTEQVYRELKMELGLDHFEGRRFRGWHHHVSVALVCYAFLVAERARAFPPSARRTPTRHAQPLAA
jgi:SRSO17 transposase